MSTQGRDADDAFKGGERIRAAQFPTAERDYQLGDGLWKMTEEWSRLDGPEQPPSRLIPPSLSGRQALREWLLGFPSAPIYRTNRLVDHQLQVAKPQPKFHSYRILARSDFKPPASDVYLLLHGLNEVDEMRFFYDFASNLMASDQAKNTICIVRPFPGHLTRHPFSGPFSQTPLDRYLTDAGDLFRQFLRYMVESRWMLSAIAPVTNYQTPIGLDLLCAPANGERSRRSPTDIAVEMREEWTNLQRANPPARHASNRVARPPRDPPDLKDFRRSVDRLRDFTGEPITCEEETPDGVHRVLDEATPRIHVVGYSLGGFVAQSIFFAWPYLIGGCTTLLSGGALRTLTPTAFANPEEWQTVLHALRYELDGSLLEKRIQRSSPTAGFTLGLPDQHFEAMLRVFYDVFQQEYRNAYQSRVEEFSRRLLFVVGGSDEIVSTQNVIDAAPEKAGVNLLQIANLSHFLGHKAKGVEQQQREYWLPEIGRLTRRFSNQSDEARREDLTCGWLRDLVTPWENVSDRLKDADLPAVGADLPSPQFEKFLDETISRLDRPRGPQRRDVTEWRRGALFIAQSTLPAFLLGPEGMRERAIALHHSDNAVVAYLAGLRDRRVALRDNEGDDDRNVCVLLPGKGPKWHRDRGPGHPSRSETLPGLLGSQINRTEEWKNIVREWGPQLRYFVPPQWEDPIDDLDVRGFDSKLVRTAAAFWSGEAARTAPTLPHAVTDLPNLWVWIDGSKLADAGRTQPGDQADTILVRRLIKTLDNFRSAAIDDVEGSKKGAGQTWEKALRRRLATEVQEDRLVCLRVSPAHFNPRHRGKVIQKGKQLHEALAFLGLCLALSVDNEPEVPATP
ncbi:MAG TPA: alpha/beta hydrolase [Acidimicrobiales bacterium]|nr:alpha/beta hydrolase [Acidimicrobiales bacterium]